MENKILVLPFARIILFCLVWPLVEGEFSPFFLAIPKLLGIVWFSLEYSFLPFRTQWFSFIEVRTFCD